MNSGLAWAGFAIAAVFLGFVGYHFTVRALRFVTLAFAAAVVVLITRYGVTHPARAPTDLVNAFTRGPVNSARPSSSHCCPAAIFPPPDGSDGSS
jgi:hypothetical protein